MLIPAYSEEFSTYYGNWRVTSEASLNRILSDTNVLGFKMPGEDALRALNDHNGPAVTNSGPFFELVNDKHSPPSIQLIRANTILLTREALTGLAVVSSFPQRVFINFTDVCNARCLFCTNTPERVDNFVVPYDDVTRMAWLKYVDELSLHGGIGEPFAHPRITDILKYFKDTLPFLKVCTTTNASLMTDKIVKAITGYLKHITISINAATESTYEAIMPPLKWQRTLANIRRLAEEKYRLGTSLPFVNLSFVAHKDNIAELPKLPAVAASLGVNQVSLIHYWYPANIPTGYAFTEQHSLINYTDLYDHYVGEAIKEFQRLAVPFNGSSRGLPPKIYIDR
ncbi:Radical SAM domain protein [Candidatus Magnetobacterium bavaricum]|uniref:Radical SAM domain protein n=1 Tax=Candidatus Magnetobacterium bavaricum TaxID=29290 RepID=A0A0F3H2M8_9BACT|nr:Radical SAM domain protein [Candidatus Magnetobacterium bavaricum]